MVILMLSKLPIGKLALLGIRQAARPVAKLAMAAAERSQSFQEIDRGFWAMCWMASSVFSCEVLVCFGFDFPLLAYAVLLAKQRCVFQKELWQDINGCVSASRLMQTDRLNLPHDQAVQA
eukprot:g27277.t1